MGRGRFVGHLEGQGQEEDPNAEARFWTHIEHGKAVSTALNDISKLELKGRRQMARVTDVLSKC